MDKPGIGEITYSEELERIREKFKSIRPHEDNKRQSPNKLLHALLAISRCLKGLDRLATFEEFSLDLKPLLVEFSPYGSSPRLNYSFWRMQNDKIWEIPEFSKVSVTKSGDAIIRSLKENHTEGGFPETDFEAFRSNPEFAVSLACELVDMHFPETLRERILEATGVREGADQVQLDKRTIWVRQSVRDSKFRGLVLNAYDGCCAICSYSLRVCDDITGVEAAHIKWHQHFGPDIVPNGIALCSIHHKLFDVGAFTVNPDGKIVVSKCTRGKGKVEWLKRFEGSPLQTPSDKSLHPAKEFLNWHREGVFRGDLLQTA